jgi:broad specificity phosphatase PhoE
VRSSRAYGQRPQSDPDLHSNLPIDRVARWDVTATVAMRLSRAEHARSALSARVRHVLFLVRHAMPAFSPETPPEQWQLDATGQRGAETLRHVIPPDAILVSSQEPKARQTLEPTGHVFTDMRFNEVSRDEPFHGDFRARRRAYVNGADHPGWEPRQQVAERFDAGINFWCTRAHPQPLVIATHGMAMTLWLAAIMGIADPAGFWAGLRLPDVFEVNLATRTVGRIASTLLFQVRGCRTASAASSPRISTGSTPESPS